MSVQLVLAGDPRELAPFLPFSDSRPVGELRYGAFLLRERWERTLGVTARGYTNVADWLQRFAEAGAPPVGVPDDHSSPVVVVRPTFVPAAGATLPTAVTEFTNLTTPDGTWIGSIAPAGFKRPANFDARSAPEVGVPGKLLQGVWDIVADLSAALKADLEIERVGRGPVRVPAGCTVIGDPSALMIDDGALVEPMVVFDTRGGPIWIQTGAEIRSGTRLAGSLLIGAATRVNGGQIRESAIGPKCVVHGEISMCNFLGYANKSHDGFLGHSVVGRWVNLGAGTINSNLKNTYGNIRLVLGNERVETGLQFLGAMIGDHAKTAIGTMIPTGCVIGAGANIFGSKRPETSVPAFAWGTDEPGRLMACRMFLQTAGKVLPRRDVAFDEAMKSYLQSLWTHCTGKPCD